MDYFKMTQNKQITALANIHNKNHKLLRLTKVQYYLHNRRLKSTAFHIYHIEFVQTLCTRKAKDNIINEED
eukprot:1949555-Amphidinium_carterae.1